MGIERTRRGAAAALGEAGDERGLPVLLSALKDTSQAVRVEAIFALGDIDTATSRFFPGDRTVPALAQALRDGDEQVRRTAAAVLGEFAEDDDRAAASALMAALKQKRVELVSAAYGFFVVKGEAGSESVLIEALNRYGTRDMAVDYLNCGNARLQNTARAWASDHGYTITTVYGGARHKWRSQR